MLRKTSFLLFFLLFYCKIIAFILNMQEFSRKFIENVSIFPKNDKISITLRHVYVILQQKI